MTDVGRAVWIGGAAVLLVFGMALLAASVLTADAANESPPAVTSAQPSTALAPLHEAGITGENVTVGVVDVTGFDAGHAAYRDQVVATRSFAPDGSITNGGVNGHGTAAAATVARAAPGADLYLASFDTETGYERALAWLTRRGVDVVVAPVSFYGKPGGGTGPAAVATTRAVRNGTVVVAPVGNLARGHWSGRYDDVIDGTVEFSAGTRNYLASDSRELTLWLSWDAAHRSQNYTAELYWTNGTATRLVARSQPYAADAAPNERIVASLDPGSYFVTVSGPPTATGARLELESPTHRFQYRDASGSIASPATAPGVLAVGASGPRATAVEPFSSRGPTGDGRLGVDVVAPNRFAAGGDRFVGSSASAAYVAGVSALVVERRLDATPREVERLVERTAVDVRPSGLDARSGHGHVAPRRAVEAANESAAP